MPRKKVKALSEPIPAGEYFVCQRLNGDIDSFHLAETDLLNVKPGKYRGNAEPILESHGQLKDPEFRGTWDFYDGGILRPATRDELMDLMFSLMEKMNAVSRKLKESQ